MLQVLNALAHSVVILLEYEKKAIFIWILQIEHLVYSVPYYHPLPPSFHYQKSASANKRSASDFKFKMFQVDGWQKNVGTGYSSNFSLDYTTYLDACTHSWVALIHIVIEAGTLCVTNSFINTRQGNRERLMSPIWSSTWKWRCNIKLHFVRLLRSPGEFLFNRIKSWKLPTKYCLTAQANIFRTSFCLKYVI